jgi:hypothetical protein
MHAQKVTPYGIIIATHGGRDTSKINGVIVFSHEALCDVCGVDSLMTAGRKAFHHCEPELFLSDVEQFQWWISVHPPSKSVFPLEEVRASAWPPDHAAAEARA